MTYFCSKMRIMAEITEKTRLGMSLAQWGVVTVFLIGMIGGFVGFAASFEETKRLSKENKSRIDVNESRVKQLEYERAADNKELLEMIYQIRESQTRIEGKLDLKQDRFK